MGGCIDISGQVFGHLTAITRSDDLIAKSGRRRVMWVCRCTCGVVKPASAHDLRAGKIKSCGCRVGAKTSFTHGHSGSGRGKTRSKEYRSWAHMRERCNNPKNKNFLLYGGRGISVCPSWDDFSVFLADMGFAPTPKHTLDRIDNSKGYGPDNCRWATQTEQVRNRRNTKTVACNGVTLPVQEWASKVGVRAGLIKDRLRLGWDPEAAIFTPAGTRFGPCHIKPLTEASSPS